MKVYISGQITGLDLEQARVNFEQAERRIIELGNIHDNPGLLK